MAEGEMLDDGFVVFKGSKANIEESKTAGSYVVGLRQKLLNDKILALKDNVYIFQEDFVFNSPSAAAVTVLGRRANGWVEWRNKSGKTIDELYRVEVDQAINS